MITDNIKNLAANVVLGDMSAAEELQREFTRIGLSKGDIWAVPPEDRKIRLTKEKKIKVFAATENLEFLQEFTGTKFPVETQGRTRIEIFIDDHFNTPKVTLPKNSLIKVRMQPQSKGLFPTSVELTLYKEDSEFFCRVLPHDLYGISYEKIPWNKRIKWGKAKILSLGGIESRFYKSVWPCVNLFTEDGMFIPRKDREHFSWSPKPKGSSSPS